MFFVYLAAIVLSLVAFILSLVAILGNDDGDRVELIERGCSCTHEEEDPAKFNNVYVNRETSSYGLEVRGPALKHQGQVVLSVPNGSQDLSTVNNSAISVDTALTRLRSTAFTETRTLGDGKAVGQLKTLLYDLPAEPEEGDAHLNVNVAKGEGGRPEVITFFRKGQCRTLVWMGDRWNLLSQTLSDIAFDTNA